MAVLVRYSRPVRLLHVLVYINPFRLLQHCRLLLMTGLVRLLLRVRLDIFHARRSCLSRLRFFRRVRLTLSAFGDDERGRFDPSDGIPCPVS